jgi:GNAT superfamily N-acetyltransferase
MLYNQEISIIPIREEDLEKIHKIQTRSFEKDYYESLTVFESIVRQFPDGALTIVLDNAFAGYTFFHPYHRNIVKPINQPILLDGTEDVMYINDIAILPEFRGMNLPDLFICHIDKTTRKYGFTAQSLTAVQHSESYWEYFGFVKAFQVNNSGYKDACYMTRHIQ